MASSSRFVRELLECRDDNFALRDNKNARMGKMSFKPKYEVKPEHLRVGGIGVYGGEVATTKTTSVIGPGVDALAISAALAGINNETAAMNIQHPIEQHHPHQQQQHHQQQQQAQQQPQHHEQQQQHPQQQQQPGHPPPQQQLYKCNECGSRWANLKTFRMHQRKHKEQKQEEEKYVMQEFQASTQNVVPPNLNTNISSDIPKPIKKPRRAQPTHVVHQVVTTQIPQQVVTTQIPQQVTVTTVPKEAPRFVPNNVPVKDTPPVPCGPTLKCSECGTRWGNNLTFRKHKERKSTPNFCCPVCELKCWSRCELSYHLMTHREGDIFVCTMCGYRAGTKIHLLKEHMNAEHEGEMEPPPPPQPPQPPQQQQQQQQQTSAGGGSSAYFENV